MEELQVPTWLVWVGLILWVAETGLVVWMGDLLYSLSGILVLACVVVQNLALACGVLWRLKTQAVLL